MEVNYSPITSLNTYLLLANTIELFIYANVTEFFLLQIISNISLILNIHLVIPIVLLELVFVTYCIYLPLRYWPYHMSCFDIRNGIRI